MQSSCCTSLPCLCPITFWTSASIWHWEWLVAMSPTVWVPPGVLFLCCKPIISFHAPLLLPDGRQWTILLKGSLRLKTYQSQTCQFLLNSSTTITSHKRRSPPNLTCVCKDSTVWGALHEEADLEYESCQNGPCRLGSLGNYEWHPSTRALVASVQAGGAWGKGPCSGWYSSSVHWAVTQHALHML